MQAHLWHLHPRARRLRDTHMHSLPPQIFSARPKARVVLGKAGATTAMPDPVRGKRPPEIKTRTPSKHSS
jgi:hypothetical protein